tara:strand:+ start:3255 stop:3365 length:111 start_codon:yes stop_codon:yes gene_type:complete
MSVTPDQLKEIKEQRDQKETTRRAIPIGMVRILIDA